MKFVHHPDFTCLTQYIAMRAEHVELFRKQFPFSGPPEDIKNGVRRAANEALSMRKLYGIKSGCMFVEIDEDNPGSGRVIDVVLRNRADESQIDIVSDKSASGGEAESPSEVIEIPCSIPDDQIDEVFSANSKVNSTPFYANDSMHDPGTLRIDGIVAKGVLVDGELRHEGVYRFSGCKPSPDDKPIDFHALPGIDAPIEPAPAADPAQTPPVTEPLNG